jgi:hypothetical protein
MSELVFVDELPGQPSEHARAARTVERMEAMQANQGRWLVWPSKSSSGIVRKLLETRDRDSDWEVESRKVGDEYKVFARYLGPRTKALTTGVEDDERDLSRTHIQCSDCKSWEACTDVHDTNSVSAALARHYRANPACKQKAVERRRKGSSR